MTLESISIGLIILCLYMTPIAMVASSKLSRGNEKTGWMLLTIFLSWIGLVIYFSTVLKKKDRAIRNRDLAQRKQRQAEALKRQQELAAQQALEAQQAMEAEQAEQNQQQPPNQGTGKVEDSI